MEIKELINHIMPYAIGVRRALHAIPEPAYKEFKTSRYIFERLSELGLNPKYVFNTGVVADINTGKKGLNIAIRADMDALPVEEKTGLDFSSENPGYMHACGHDGHMAVLLGLCMVLTKVKDRFSGTVRFIFQPAEEKPPKGGAVHLIEEGVLKNMDLIFGFHIMPAIDTGSFAIIEGAAMAACDEFIIKIKGSGGHASAPEKTTDTILVSAKLICSLNDIVSRMISPFDPVVISCGEIKGGYAFNIIPDEVVIKGTVRTFSKQTSAFVQEKIKAILNGISLSYGVDIELIYENCYSTLKNTPAVCSYLKDICKTYFGKDSIVEMKPLMGSEDFSAYLEKVPGAYVFIGGKKNQYSLHSPFYDFDEQAIKYAISLFARAVINSSLLSI